MYIIKKLLTTVYLTLAMTLPVSSLAQATMETSKTSSSMTDGEVKKIDNELGKITIKHEEIKQLDMPGMTMVFTVKDKRLLNQIKPGDKIKFMVVMEGEKMIVTAIQPAP